MMREFGPQIWSPEVTKSAVMIPADKVTLPQSRHDTSLLKFPWFGSQFFVLALLAWRWSEARGIETKNSKNSVIKEVSAVNSL